MFISTTDYRTCPTLANLSNNERESLYNVANVYGFGNVFGFGMDVNSSRIAVRPAMWINL